MNNGMDFYRLRFEFMGEDETGKLITKKQEDLVIAVNYTDAETIALEIMNDMGMTQFDDRVKYEIIKTKISEIMLTDVFVSTKILRANTFCIIYLKERKKRDYLPLRWFIQKSTITISLKNKRRHLCSRS